MADKPHRTRLWVSIVFNQNNLLLEQSTRLGQTSCSTNRHQAGRRPILSAVEAATEVCGGAAAAAVATINACYSVMPRAQQQQRIIKLGAQGRPPAANNIQQNHT